MKNVIPTDPAYPIAGFMRGLTKRELFAAMAMQGMCSNSELPQGSPKIAEWAVNQADELIKVLTTS